jgi:putative phage-type endonuclease
MNSKKQKEQEAREQWLAQRRSGIGGSDVAGILGLSSYATPQDVWESKVLDQPDDDPSGIQIRGQKLEAFAAEVFAEETGLKVRRQPLRRHREYPWMIGSIDRQIVGLPSGPEVLEIKVPGAGEFFRMKDEGLDPQYILQLQHYLEVYDYEMGRFVIFTPEYWQHYTFEVARDRELGEFLVEAEREFWHKYVLPKVRPERPLPPPNPLPRKPGEALVRSDDQWLHMSDLYRQRVYEASEASEDLKAVEAELVREAFGDEEGEEAVTAVTDGNIKVERYSTTPQRRWDAKAFRAAFELADDPSELDPEDERFYYQTASNTKTRVKVLTPWMSTIEPEEA